MSYLRHFLRSEVSTRILLAVLLSSLTPIPVGHAQHVSASGTKIDLPPGIVVGSAFDDEAGVFFVQQQVYSDVDHVLRTHRRISSWRVNRPAAISERDLDLDPPMTHLHHQPPCGSIGVAAKASRILVCSLEGVDILDSVSLKTVGRMAYGVDAKTYEIAVDEARNRVLLLSGRSGSLYPLSYSGSVWLTSYSLSDGTQQESVQLGSLGLVDHAEFAFEPVAGTVAVSLTHRGSAPWGSDVYVCGDSSIASCNNAVRVDAISQIVFSGNQLLFAADRFDRSTDCVMSIGVGKHAASESYCAPATGVRFGVGVAEGKYIIGFSGTRRRAHFMSEGFVNVHNTFALWCSGDRRSGGVANYPLDSGVQQRSMRIAGSTAKPVFLAYSGLEGSYTNELVLYSLSGCN